MQKVTIKLCYKCKEIFSCLFLSLFFLIDSDVGNSRNRDVGGRGKGKGKRAPGKRAPGRIY